MSENHDFRPIWTKDRSLDLSKNVWGPGETVEDILLKKSANKLGICPWHGLCWNVFIRVKKKVNGLISRGTRWHELFTTKTPKKKAKRNNFHCDSSKGGGGNLLFVSEKSTPRGNLPGGVKKNDQAHPGAHTFMTQFQTFSMSKILGVKPNLSCRGGTQTTTTPEGVATEHKQWTSNSTNTKFVNSSVHICSRATQLAHHKQCRSFAVKYIHNTVNANLVWHWYMAHAAFEDIEGMQFISGQK